MLRCPAHPRASGSKPVGGTPPHSNEHRKRVFRSPGVGAVMFALLPTLWVFVPTLRDPKNRRILPQALEGAWDGPGPPDSAVRPFGVPETFIFIILTHFFCSKVCVSAFWPTFWSATEEGNGSNAQNLVLQWEIKGFLAPRTPLQGPKSMIFYHFNTLF